MNQRASHFNLGDNSAGYGSIYRKDYTPKKADKDKLNINNPFRGGSLGNKDRNDFTTTNRAMMKGWDAQRTALDPNKLRELRGHHFSLGTNNINNITTHNYYYTPKQLNTEAYRNQEESKAKMRSHYHDFKEHPNTNFKTTYANHYVKKEGDQSKPIRNEGGNSIVFGNNFIPMLTTHGSDYNRKNVLPVVKSTMKQNSAVILGDIKQPMETINQVYYKQKPIIKSQLPQATIKQLRNTHFTLGGMPIQYRTQSNHYEKYPPHAKASYVPNYQTGTWQNKNAKLSSITTNKCQLPLREMQPYKKASPNTHAGFVLGNQPNNYGTQFRENYDPKNLNNENMAMAGLRPHESDNILIGTDVGTYTTQQRQNYKKYQGGKQEGLGNLNNVRQSNVQIGGIGGDDYITVYQDQYRPDQQHKSDLFHKEKERRV